MIPTICVKFCFNPLSTKKSPKSRIGAPLLFWGIIIKYVSQPICDIADQPLGLLPAQAGIRDGFAEGVFADSLSSIFDVAFDH